MSAHSPEEPDLKDIALARARNILAVAAIYGKDRVVTLAAAEAATAEAMRQTERANALAAAEQKELDKVAGLLSVWPGLASMLDLSGLIVVVEAEPPTS